MVNISTRMSVGIGDDALIAGFIIRGNASKRLIVRAIRTSVTPVLRDPILELHGPNGFLITNDNWQDNANKQEMIDVNLAPNFASDAAILTTVPSDSNGVGYTAIVRGVNNTTGVGQVEVYDLDSGPGSTILNISTRGRVGIGDDAMIGGFILRGTDAKRIVVRAIGPSLPSAQVPNPLQDPMLELHDGQGTLRMSNDNWQTDPNAGMIQANNLAPTDPRESALLDTLAPGGYTAIVRGAGATTGVALVEAYQLP